MNIAQLRAHNILSRPKLDNLSSHTITGRSVENQRKIMRKTAVYVSKIRPELLPPIDLLDTPWTKITTDIIALLHKTHQNDVRILHVVYGPSKMILDEQVLENPFPTPRNQNSAYHLKTDGQTEKAN